MLAGTLAPISRIAGAYATESWRGDVSTVFQYDGRRGLYGLRASAAGAAFANACAGNALDIDDDAIFTRGHPGAQLIPTVLAVGEKLGASGREVLEALVVGYEIAIPGRALLARLPHGLPGRRLMGFHGMRGRGGPPARLDAEQIGHALGIAEYHAPNVPMMRDIADPAMVKHGIGWGAMTGVTVGGIGGLRLHRHSEHLRLSANTLTGSRTSAAHGGWPTGCSTKAGPRARGDTPRARLPNN